MAEVLVVPPGFPWLRAAVPDLGISLRELVLDPEMPPAGFLMLEGVMAQESFPTRVSR